MEKLRAFLEKRPALKLHYGHQGSFESWARYFMASLPQEQPGRLARLIINEAAARGSSPESLAQLSTQLERYPLISTADHAGLLNYQIIFNANLLMAGMLRQEALPFLVSIPTGYIPMNNASWPRGFFFAGQRFNLYPGRLNHVLASLVDEAPAPHGSVKEILGRSALDELDPAKVAFLEHLLVDFLGFGSNALTGLRFIDSSAQINQRLWKIFFDKSLRSQIPTFLSLPRDRLMNAMIIDDLQNPYSQLYRILFVPGVRSMYLEEFKGLHGCWHENGGSQFFWGINSRRLSYALEVSSDGCRLEPRIPGSGEAIALEPEAIALALEGRKLVPTLFTNMFLLTFVEGFTLLGGFNQVTYLAWMRLAHERCLLRLGEWPQAARVAQTLSNGLICGLLPFPQWASSLDMIWTYNSQGGVFNGSLDRGLDDQAMTRMMEMSMQGLIQNGLDAMLNVVE